MRRAIKVHCVQREQSVMAFVVEALKDKLRPRWHPGECEAMRRL